jgi:predicted  nucleic acid-binding Zn-ribbon protein
MSSHNLQEYENSFDFGFTAVDSEENVIEKPVVNTQEIVQPVSDEIAALRETIDAIYAKLDNLEEVILAGSGATFDIDSYKSLVDKEAAAKLKTLEGLIMPLLVNLMKNPTKDYIKWPNRVPVIETQISKILAITRPGS